MMSVDLIHQFSIATCEHCQFRWKAVIDTHMIVWGNSWPNTIMMAHHLECPNCGQQTKINNDENME
jgi:DNA-directed RNA polymerase subunit M/transcription elongation factor TFIIS